LNVQDAVDPGVPEPGKILVSEEVFLVMDKEPKTTAIDMCHLSRNAGARRG
jgi:hypothetical protein